ncbi:Protein PRY2 [Pleurostoma richardsiae]|uniref:Protein PRY2 n=1 Tax=Pleurostoma richardsiae TaxID=41990 RepID=A0AA38VVW9_9PEZI|nr:Protein PRY2 [Pleurostoma richardsiae]
MRSSILLLVSGAILAMASPVEKRAMKTVIETDVVWVTVTEGESASMFFAGPHKHLITTTSTTSTSSSVPTSTSTSTSVSPAPPPPETTSTTEPTPTPTPTVVGTPTPEPTTSEEPAPAVETTTVAEQAAAVETTAVESSTAAATSPAAAVDDETAQPTDLASTAVYHHNIHRENNSAPAISWGETYAGYAEQVSASCKFAHDLTPGGGGYGQNIATWGSSGDAESLGAEKAIAQAITDMWYNGEISLYPSSAYGQDNPDFTNFEGWGHYSQVVWVGSTQVGCHARYCAPGTMFETMGAWFSVCNYYPAGNMGGEYGANVLPPLGKSTVTA